MTCINDNWTQWIIEHNELAYAKLNDDERKEWRRGYDLGYVGEKLPETESIISPIGLGWIMGLLEE